MLLPAQQEPIDGERTQIGHQYRAGQFSRPDLGKAGMVPGMPFSGDQLCAYLPTVMGTRLATR